MKKIEEIRIAGESDRSRTATIGMNFGYLFLKYMGDGYTMGKEVNILVIQASFREQNEQVGILPNDVSTYNLYFIYTRISKEYFHQLDDFEKLEFICKCVYLSLLEWAERFDQPLEPIHNAYKKIIEDEYFLEKTQKYKSKNKKYTCRLEYRNEYSFVTFRLIVEDNKTKERAHYFVCEKEYFRDDELMKTDFMKWLEMPRDLKVSGWTSDVEFEMTWGEERYVFNTERKEIAMFEK